jgi:hypothetical protein
MAPIMGVRGRSGQKIPLTNVNGVATKSTAAIVAIEIVGTVRATAIGAGITGGTVTARKRPLGTT